MAYLLENETDKLIGDILKKKEFNQYKLPNENEMSKWSNIVVPKKSLDSIIDDMNILQFHSYQLFISKYINPNTPYSRILMKWQTGVGKSIGSLSIAMNFIKYFKKEFSNENSAVGSIFILGFTASSIFKPELLRFPEFGIINRKELKKINKLKKSALSGNIYFKNLYTEFLIKMKKNINDRQKNGFYEFIGYKKLVNMLFLIKDKNINLSNLNEHQIQENINNGKIELNIELLNKFKNSLVICDEIHNVYNSLNKNNWGIAIQYLLNYDESIRAVFMSATPINNKPSEIIELLNFLLPSKYYPKLIKSEYFTKENQLKPNALDKIRKLCKGRISYLKDSNPKHYPSRTFIGDNITDIKYLKFVRCPMSKFHYNTYDKNFTGTLAIDSNYLVDFAIPNPNNATEGIFQTTDIKTMINNAPTNWKNANKINFKNDKIMGDILQIDNLKTISTKYSTMMETILKNIKNKSGKTFIYHNFIHISGVLFIEEILLNNYIISEHGSSSDNTLCAICGYHQKSHIIKEGGYISEDVGSKGYHNSSSDNIIIGIRILLNQLIIKSKSPNSAKHNVKNNNITIIYNTNTKYYDIINNNKIILEFIIFNELIIINLCFVKLTDLIIDIIDLLIKKHKVIIKLINPTKSKQKKITFYGKFQNLEHTKKIIKCKYNDKKNNKEIMLYYTNDATISKKNIFKDFVKKFYKYYNRIINSIDKFDIKRGGKPINSNKLDHTFMPVKFIVVHSEIDKNKIYSMLNKFNSIDNSNGHRIMILIGGKVMKESYDIKAVRELMIMGRPDNIPTLIQIMGRTIRKNSHRYLEEYKKNVNVRIFTSCLPIKDKSGKYKLSIEEIKYKEKISEYIVIQNIEKVLHENAIDSFINSDIINPTGHKNNSIDEIGDLYFEPNINNLPSVKYQNKKLYDIDINSLDISNYNAYYSDEEIDNIKYIIKRFFIEVSSVWSYNDLLNAVKNTNNYFNIEFNAKLINDSFFNIALSFLIFIDKNEYIEPVFHNNYVLNNLSEKEIFIDRLFNTDEKIIYNNGIQSIIYAIGEYLILLPYDEVLSEPIKITELPYRNLILDREINIDINNFLYKSQNIISYSDKKERFHQKWLNTPLVELELAVCDFGTDFHRQFLEEVIEYIFNVWTNNKIKKSNMHNFYFKMIKYYNLRKIVIWGDSLKTNTIEKYSKYMIIKKNKLKERKKTKRDQTDLGIDDIQKNIDKNDKVDDAEETGSSGFINMLKSSINQSDLNWVSTGMNNQFNEELENSLKLFDGIYKKKLHIDKGEKVDASLIPVGHFLLSIPRFYLPELKWYDNPEYLQNNIAYVENNIIIGYDERSDKGIHIRFKIRNPIQNIKQFSDNRMIEKGAVCSTKSKSYLKDIAIKIGIKFTKTKFNVDVLCNDIRTRLLYLELNERVKKTNIKWFYFVYETRPEIISN
jgi:hypothetical protein